MPLLVDLTNRDRVSEIMDTPDLDVGRHAQALDGIARLNHWADSKRILWKPLAALARECPGSRLRVLDIASGGGDVPIALDRLARSHGLPMEFVGCDVSPVAVAHATKRAEANDSPARFFQCDLLRDGVPDGYDAITCSLFLHHLEADAAKIMLRQMIQRAERLVLVHDLRRSQLGYGLAYGCARLLTRSDVVRYDAPASVRSAFSLPEVRALTQNAGWGEYTLVKKWPCRFLLTWRRT
jgi:SAM-dependent methyltransferase